MEGNSSVLVLYTESDVMFVLGAQKGEGLGGALGTSLLLDG